MRVRLGAGIILFLVENDDRYWILLEPRILIPLVLNN